MPVACQSSGSQQAVVRQSSVSHRQLSGRRQAVIRQPMRLKGFSFLFIKSSFDVTAIIFNSGTLFSQLNWGVYQDSNCFLIFKFFYDDIEGVILVYKLWSNIITSATPSTLLKSRVESYNQPFLSHSWKVQKLRGEC